MSKPYLKVTNTLSGKVYKLRPGKVISYGLKGDTVVRYSKIISFTDSTIRLKGYEHDMHISPSDISYIHFKPKSKLRRISKLLFYASWIGLGVYIFSVAECNDAACPNPQYLYTIITAFVAIPLAELSGLVMQGATPYRDLYGGKNLNLEIVR